MQPQLPFYTLLSAVFCGCCVPPSILFWLQRGMRGMPPVPCDVKVMLCVAVAVATVVLAVVARFIFSRKAWSRGRQDIVLLLLVSFWSLPLLVLAWLTDDPEWGKIPALLAGWLISGVLFCWPAVAAVVARRWSVGRPEWAAFRYLLAGLVQLVLIICQF